MRTAALNGEPLTFDFGGIFLVVLMPSAEREFCRASLYAYGLHGTSAERLASKHLPDVKGFEDLDLELNRWVERLLTRARQQRLKDIYTEVARQLRQPLSSLYVKQEF